VFVMDDITGLRLERELPTKVAVVGYVYESVYPIFMHHNFLNLPASLTNLKKSSTVTQSTCV